MILAKVGEFVDISSNNITNNQCVSKINPESNADSWENEKSFIIEYTKTIHYRTCDEWEKELKSAGFHLHATMHYNSNNPQKLFYAVYQLE